MTSITDTIHERASGKRVVVVNSPFNRAIRTILELVKPEGPRTSRMNPALGMPYGQKQYFDNDYSPADFPLPTVEEVRELLHVTTAKAVFLRCACNRGDCDSCNPILL